MTRPTQNPMQLTLGESAEPSPQTRRALRRGPLTRIGRPPPAGRADQEPQPAARPLDEWHVMTPGAQLAAWAGLRAWVTWLHDRYELSADDRLPRCWAEHPGLIEELYALKVWREEIYAGPQPSGQAARYWHSELRQVIHAATTGTPRAAAPATAPPRPLPRRTASSRNAGLPRARWPASRRRNGPRRWCPGGGTADGATTRTWPPPSTRARHANPAPACPTCCSAPANGGRQCRTGGSASTTPAKLPAATTASPTCRVGCQERR